MTVLHGRAQYKLKEKIVCKIVKLLKLHSKWLVKIVEQFPAMEFEILLRFHICRTLNRSYVWLGGFPLGRPWNTELWFQIFRQSNVGSDGLKWHLLFEHFLYCHMMNSKLINRINKSQIFLISSYIVFLFLYGHQSHSYSRIKRTLRKESFLLSIPASGNSSKSRGATTCIGMASAVQSIGPIQGAISVKLFRFRLKIYSSPSLGRRSNLHLL